MSRPVTNRLRATEEGTEKWCARCCDWWPADTEFFWADPARHDGLWYCCKACYHSSDRRPSRRGLVQFVPFGQGAGGPAYVELGAVVHAWAAGGAS